MKKLLLIILAGLLAIGASVPALAFGPVDIEAELPYYSKYVWRGMNRVDDSVLQPSLGLGLFGFELGFWGNYDLTDINGSSGEFTQVDYTLGYEFTLPKIALGAGFIHYTFPDSDVNSTTEFYLSGEVGVLLSPKLAAYFDIDEIKGTYWEASINHDFGLGETSKLNLEGGLGMGTKGYIEGYFGLQAAGPNNEQAASATDYYLTASVPYHPVPLFTIVPSVTYTALLSDAKNTVGGNSGLYYGKEDNFYWGISAIFQF